MKKNIVFFILFFGNVFSQDFSIGFNYSNLLTSKNYESVSIYSLEGEYEFLENTLSAGLAASYIDARINNNFIKNPPQDNPIENTFKLGLQGKYFPYFYKNDSFTIKPYIGIELGLYTSTILKRFHQIAIWDELYSFDAEDKFYANFSVGAIIFPEQSFSFLFGLKYQIYNPTIKYEKPNPFENNSNNPFSEYSEKVNFNMLLWNIGFKINF